MFQLLNSGKISYKSISLNLSDKDKFKKYFRILPIIQLL